MLSTAAALLALFAQITIAHGAEAEARPRVGEWAITDDVANYPACHSVDDLLRYYELYRSDEYEYHKAAREFLSQHCTLVEGGTEVMVEDTSWQGASCVRPRVNLDCVWIVSLAVESKAEAARVKNEFKAIDDAANQAFDKEHPECSGWRTNKHLPDYCY